MECWNYREAASAQLDNEDPGVDPARLEEHLAGCVGCRDWLADAVQVTRALRLRRVDDVPDMTGPVLARVKQRRRVIPAAGMRAAARVALFAVAAAQWAAGLTMVFDQAVGASLPVHGAHEMGAFNLAVAVAFAWTAWRPGWARAQLPLLSSLVGVMAVLTGWDLATGRAAAVAEAGHLLLVVGLVLTVVLARRDAGPGAAPAGAGTTTPRAPDGGGRQPSSAPARPWRPRVARSAKARARRGRRAA